MSLTTAFQKPTSRFVLRSMVHPSVQQFLRYLVLQNVTYVQVHNVVNIVGDHLKVEN